MQKFIAVGLMVLALTLANRARAAEGDIHLAGGAVVPVPAEGFEWTPRKHDGPAARLETFIASKPQSRAHVMLIADPKNRDTDDDRLTCLAGAVLENITSLQDQKFSQIKPEKPEVKRPIPQRVSFSVSGLARSGTVHYYFYNVLIFGKKTTYQFQAISTSEEEAKELIKVAEAIKDY
jgi:hypothetical protein